MAGGRDRFCASRHRRYRCSRTRGRDGVGMNWRAKWMIALGAALLSGLASAENKYDYCLLCHGTNANGNYGIRAPKLSGMEPWYLARQLENFAAGIRGAPEQDFSGHEMRVVGIRLEQEKVLQDAVKFIAALESKKPA